MTLNSNQQRAEFMPVYNGRKRKVRSLSQRGGTFYARLKITYPGEEEAKVRRVPLKAKTVPEATKELRALQVKRDKGQTIVRERTPTLKEYGQKYIDRLSVGNRKRPATITSESGHFNFWAKELGQRRLHGITAGQIQRALDRRAADGRAPRTLNIALTTLRNIYSEAIADGLVDDNPCLKVKWRKLDRKERKLVTADELDRLCEAALKASKNGQQFSDYLRLLQYSGGRMAETLRLRWKDVDWGQKQLVIGADGGSKNHEARHVDFNTSLETHLKDMHRRRDCESQWIFPSPQRGRKDIPSKSFRETLRLAREEAGLEHVGFHDTRHHFISMSVMAGIDYMTIAAWVGHKDGGILIGKVYGHLANEHRQRAAQKLVLGTMGVIGGEKIEAA
jgi:integrase